MAVTYIVSRVLLFVIFTIRSMDTHLPGVDITPRVVARVVARASRMVTSQNTPHTPQPVTYHRAGRMLGGVVVRVMDGEREAGIIIRTGLVMALLRVSVRVTPRNRLDPHGLDPPMEVPVPVRRLWKCRRQLI